MEFGILGTLTARNGDAEIPVPGTRLRTLLALLVVADGGVVTADRLADDLWGDAIPAGAANALQSLVSKLRRILGDQGSIVVTEPTGYRLDLARVEVDARGFDRELMEGRAALDAGDAATAAERIAAALDRWRGPALDGLTDNDALHREAMRLDELRVAALEDRCDADLRCGRHAELVPELQQLTVTNPVRERIHAQLMLALYRCGRQAEALRAYQDAREMLADELGLDPGPELQELEAAILDQDPALTPSAASPSAAPVATSRLGTSLSRFVGRTAEITELGALVGDHRLVTVVGPGGAGKTRLSIEVAARRPGGEPVWFVELAPVPDAQGVLGAVANAVGATDGIVGESAGDDAPTDRLARFIGTRPCSLLLDNCEHVIDEAARVAEALLVACPELRILATSREQLAIGGEMVWPIPSMAIDDAVELFADRASATSAFVLDDASEAVVSEVCDRLDGLPLAVELAAGRVRAIPVGQLASRLDDRFRLLTGGARTALPRQQTLRAVVEWSYDLLFDDERRVFERLSVFAGGCSLEAAEAVCAGDDVAPEDVADLLAHLVDKSLVTVSQASGVARFDLLQTLALYGQERLAAAGEMDTTRRRHADHFAALCARGPDAFRGDRQVPWLREVHTEADNLRAALGWTVARGDAERAQAMIGGLGWSFWFSGRGEEGWRWFVTALDLPGESAPATRAFAAMWACYVGYAAGTGMDLALAYGIEAVELARTSGDRRLLAEATMLLAGANIGIGDLTRAAELFDESHEMFATGTDDWSRALSANAKGRAAAMRGDLDTAERFMTESVVHFTAAGVEWAKALVNDDIAQLAEDRGDIATATAGIEGARQAAVDLGLGGAEALFTARLGNYALIRGDVTLADALHAEALVLGETVGFPRSLAFTYNGRAMVRRATGDLDEAAVSAERAQAMCHRSHDVMGEALALASLGFVAERQGDLARARARHTEGLELARAMNDAVYLALALEGLAGVAAAEGDGTRAAELLGCAHALRATKGGAPAGPASDVDRITVASRGQCGDDYDEAFARGEATTPAALV